MAATVCDVGLSETCVTEHAFTISVRVGDVAELDRGVVSVAVTVKL